MEKSIHSPEYATLLELLREMRQAAGVTQVQLAKRLRRTQSIVSKMELGEVRLDVIQLRAICAAISTTLPEFCTRFRRTLVEAAEAEIASLISGLM